jgi:SAM-dependent methyltransferase
MEPNVICEVDCFLEPGGRCELPLEAGYSDRSGLVGAVGVARCARCGVGVSQPPLPDVAFLYADRTSQDFQSRAGGLERMIKSVAFRMQARRLLAQLRDPKPRRVIDFGCGSGQFTDCLAQVLGDAQVTGADFHESPPGELRHADYRPNSELATLEASADLVIAMHVLEHDDAPRALLQRISALARPGGAVVIEVPNIDCAWTRVFGAKWDAWYLPYHRAHYSRAALSAVVESSDLEILNLVDVCVPTMGRTLANVFGRPGGVVFLLAGIALHPLQWMVEQVTGRPSALRVIARRR